MMGLEKLEEELSEHMAQMGERRTPASEASPRAADGTARKAAVATQNIPLKVEAIVGSLRMTISELETARPGQVLALQKSIGEPIDLVVNNIKVASAELIALEGEPTAYGLRIIAIEGADGV